MKDNVVDLDFQLINAVLYNNIEKVKLLLEKGADPNIQNENGYTALSIAKIKEYNDIIELLENYQKYRIKFCFVSEKAKKIYNNKPPVYASKKASGFDLRAVSFDNSYDQFGAIHNAEERKSGLPTSVESYTLYSKRRILVKTGIKINIQSDKLTELQIRSRSGLTLKSGLIVLNGIGTIDQDYTGEIGVILYNAGVLHQDIEIGDRIAQGVFNPLFQAFFEEITIEEFDLNTTERGSNGFGSTGSN